MSACPQCGFSFAWDGATCGHCHFPTPRLPTVMEPSGCADDGAEWEPESGTMEALHAPLTDQEMISAAQVMPGFSDDLSRWRVTIRRDGELRQEVFLATSANMYRDELWQVAVQLCPADVNEILALANQIGFRGFRDSYSHETMIVTDLPTWFISIRFGDEIKTVYANGPYSIAKDENNRDMAGFVELWERIHRHAPYPKATLPRNVN